MTTSEPKAGAQVVDVKVTEDHLVVDLLDGRSVAACRSPGTRGFSMPLPNSEHTGKSLARVLEFIGRTWTKISLSWVSLRVRLH